VVTVICSLHFLTCHIRFVLNQTYPTFVEKYSKYYKTYTLKRWNKGVVLPLETGERDQAFTAVSLVFFCEKDEPKKTRDWLSNWSVARVVMWMEMGMSSCKFSLTFSISVAVRAYLNALLLGHACIMVCDEECPCTATHKCLLQTMQRRCPPAAIVGCGLRVYDNKWWSYN
jgi:hypothetical protein